jgi:hypothetical protein
MVGYLIVGEVDGDGDGEGNGEGEGGRIRVVLFH